MPGTKPSAGFTHHDPGIKGEVDVGAELQKIYHVSSFAQPNHVSMSSLPELPAHIVAHCDQFAEAGIRDPEVYADNALLEQRKQALRRQFEASLSAQIARRNDDLKRKDARALPRDVLLEVMDRLSLRDVIAASGVCMKWRNIALQRATLWTELTVYATLEMYDNAGPGDEDDFADGYENCFVFSNLRFVQELLLPRSKSLPLSLTVDVDSPVLSPRFFRELESFLASISNRLSALDIQTECTYLVAQLFHDSHHQWRFPVLRELVLGKPGRSFLPTDFAVDLGRVQCPSLARLDLREGFQLARPTDPAHLPVTFLRTRITHVLDVVPLLGVTPGLKQLACRAFYDELAPEDLTLSPAACDAISVLQEVCFRTELRDDDAPDDLLAFFMSTLCNSVVLEFECCSPETPFRPALSGRWVDVARIVLRDTPDSLDIVLADDAGRTLTIRLLGCDKRAQCLDWARVVRLPTMSALHVDASAWCIAMQNFPDAPVLANTTLVVGADSGLDALIRNGTEGSDSRPGYRTTADLDMNGVHHPRAGQDFLHVDPEPENGWLKVPPVPRGSSLTLSSDIPVSMTTLGLADVRRCLVVERIALDGVAMDEHASMKARLVPDVVEPISAGLRACT